MNRLEIDIGLKRFAPVDRADEQIALKDVRLGVPSGAFVCVVGPSGCGKTTLLNIVAGLDRAFDGRIDYGDNQVRPRIGYVFQEPRLLPWRTAGENIELVLSHTGRHSGIVDELLAATGLEKARHVYTNRLSLGMSRRVALARAFAVEPELLLMDEPFVSLDEATARQLRLLLLDIWRARPTTVLFVTHDLREAIALADRIVILSPSPGSVLAEVPVDLPRDRRGDEAAIDAFRETLLRRQEAAFEGVD